MLTSLRILAVVPARGGSKGVPKKNIRTLGGEPLIGHTLRKAKAVNEINRLIVSTDDTEIASIAQSYGVEVLDRPADISTDLASTESVLLHAIRQFVSKGEIFDVVIVLEPTSPFRSIDTIKRAIYKFNDKSVESVVAVRKSTENIGLINAGVFMPIVPDAPRRRQLRNPIYIESSTIYAARIDFLVKNKSLVSDKWTSLVVSNQEAIDINTEYDLQYAEFHLENITKN